MKKSVMILVLLLVLVMTTAAQCGFGGTSSTAVWTPTSEAPDATQAAGGSIGNGQQLAEEAWGESLPWPPVQYVAGGPGMPEICFGMCWDFSHIGVLRWYGPNAGEEDITQSDRQFGNGQKGPLDLMRDGDVTRVIFPVTLDAVMEICPRGQLDGRAIAEYLSDAGYGNGDCGRFPISAGWHLVEGNSGFPQAGFGIRFEASGWSSMNAAQIREYTQYWQFTNSGTTATWTGPTGREIIMIPSMIQAMQDFRTLDTVVFTTSSVGELAFCNGNVTGTASYATNDGRCETFPNAPAGTYTYHAPASQNRTSAGISWQPQ